MKKRILIIVAIVAVIIIATIVYTHYVPVWASIVNAISFVAGAFVGGFYMYKRLKEGKEDEK
jgi:phosphate/sulfate permease